MLEDHFAGLETALTPERYALIKEIFLKVVAVEDGLRESVLDEACGQDEDLRREIESLLQYHHESDEPGSAERLH